MHIPDPVYFVAYLYFLAPSSSSCSDDPLHGTSKLGVLLQTGVGGRPIQTGELLRGGVESALWARRRVVRRQSRVSIQLLLVVAQQALGRRPGALAAEGHRASRRRRGTSVAKCAQSMPRQRCAGCEATEGCPVALRRATAQAAVRWLYLCQCGVSNDTQATRSVDCVYSHEIDDAKNELGTRTSGHPRARTGVNNAISSIEPAI